MTHSIQRLKVVFIWPATPELKSYFHEELDRIVDIEFCESRQEADIAFAVQSADIVVGWAVKESILKAAKTVGLVIIPAIGVDRHIPILRKFPNIQAVNSRGNAIPTAQHTVALLLAATNYITHFDHHVRNGKWRAFNDEPPSVLLENCNIGILGTGTIGKAVIQRLKGFGCHLVGCSYSGSTLSEHPEIQVYPVAKLKEFLKQCRVLIIAVPNTPSTTGMIGAPEINCMAEDAILINIARGPVVCEEALYLALKNRRLLSAGIDVWYNYQPDETNGKKFPFHYPFDQLDNIVLSPHRASSPLRRPGRYIDVVDNIKRFANNQPLTNLIDLEKGY